MPVNIKAVVITALYSTASLIVVLLLSWMLLSQMNFSYGLWHDIDIGWAIDEYGPQNRYKDGFGDTSRDERIRVFNEIRIAVENGGSGLDSIVYNAPGYDAQILLREPEVIHLQDVANLITACKKIAYGAAVVWMALIVYFSLTHVRPPNFIKQLVALIGLVAIATVLIFIVGPVKVFSYMHEVVFPDGHQWFFYYQESLMSTMMWAPRLFGWIAVEWLLFTIIGFALLQYASDLLLKRAASRWQLGKGNAQRERS